MTALRARGEARRIGRVQHAAARGSRRRRPDDPARRRAVADRLLRYARLPAGAVGGEPSPPRGSGLDHEAAAREDGGALLVRGEFTFPGEDATTPPDEAVDLIRAYVRTAAAAARGPPANDPTADPAARTWTTGCSPRWSTTRCRCCRARRIAARFRELEVEITDDTPDGLLEEVLDRLRAAGAGAPDPTPKYVRAVGPLATLPPEVEVGAARPRRDREPGPRAGRSPRRSCHLLRHDVVIRLDADPEGVHQARVATRRLRSDLRTFRSMLDPELGRAASRGAALARDGPRRGAGRRRAARRACAGRVEMIPATEAPGVAQVIEALQQRRKEAHTALIASISGERYVALLDRLRRGGPGAGRASRRRRRAGPGHRCRPARRTVASPARGREGGGQASGGRRAAHRSDPGQAGAVRRRGSGSDRRQACTRSSPRRRPSSRRSWASTTTRWSRGPGCGRGPPGGVRATRRSPPACSPGSSAPRRRRAARGGARCGSASSRREEAM